MILAILFSIVASAFFSGMEIAFVTSSRLRFELDKRTHTLAGRVLHIYQRSPENFISTLLVGNNIALIIFGIFMSDLLRVWIESYVNNDAVMFFIQTIISTLIILITAEFLPKNLFRINPNLFMRFFALPLFPIYLLLYPISRLTGLLSRLLLRIFGVKVSSADEEYHFSKIDLDHFIQQGIEKIQNEEHLDPEVKIFQNALDFQNAKLRDCIIPRTEIIATDFREPLESLTALFIEKGISKMIVYKDTIDNIIGYFHVSELFNQPADWRKSIRPVQFVPETMNASKLMKRLMVDKKSMAVVVDEFGGTAGIVTLEDLVEEILGEIEDEHDIDKLVAKANPDGTFLLSGRMEIDRVNEQFDLDIPESEEYLTVAGFILHNCQRFPQLHETLEIAPFTIRVIKVSATKIELVTIKR